MIREMLLTKKTMKLKKKIRLYFYLLNSNIYKVFFIFWASLFYYLPINAENGYNLWLRYYQINDLKYIENYKKSVAEVYIIGQTPIINSAKEELEKGIKGIIGNEIKYTSNFKNNSLIIGCYELLPNEIKNDIKNINISSLSEEGYLIKVVSSRNNYIIITANTDRGILYGVFSYLRLIQMEQSIEKLEIIDVPKLKFRLLNHWDNLNRTVERGYAGCSIWDWQRLPDYIDQRYIDYARANASIGINGAVLTNVNANAIVLTRQYLEKVAALANVFRKYGIKVYLTARFSAPKELGFLDTADPLNEDVQKWWNEKAKEIYTLIPDFGGFLVKANSEGQPGPQEYERTHADGANMLAKAIKPYGGIVMWRAFVYDHNVPDDRAKQAYNEFVPLDGKFEDNVLIQVKNGPIDFQPREPFHPLFGAMPNTPLMMEFQITQEYLGFSTHLVFLGKLYEEVLQSDTYSKGKGSFVAKVIDGSLHNYNNTGMAGVSNIGSDINWTGHLFGQANWYAFGRLAWNPYLSSEKIADEWIRLTFNNNKTLIDIIKNIMLISHETTVNYMTPLGLHHIMGWSNHYGPAPWIDKGRPDWTSVYYHRANEKGLGFDRSSTGSNSVNQYFPPLNELFNNIETCPEKYLLWFHHVNWDYKLKSGNTLWNELCYKYQEGCDSVNKMIESWQKVKGLIDEERYNHVLMLLKIQYKEAIWWKNSCLSYFQSFSKRPFPKGVVPPDHPLEYYMNLKFYYVPGI